MLGVHALVGVLRAIVDGELFSDDRAVRGFQLLDCRGGVVALGEQHVTRCHIGGVVFQWNDQVLAFRGVVHQRRPHDVLDGDRAVVSLNEVAAQHAFKFVFRIRRLMA